MTLHEQQLELQSMSIDIFEKKIKKSIEKK